MVVSAGAGLWTRLRASPIELAEIAAPVMATQSKDSDSTSVSLMDPRVRSPRRIFFRQDTSPHTPQAHILTPAHRRVTRQIEGLIQKVNNYG